MKSQEFCYWLQGLFECSEPPVTQLSARQTELIKRHLALVFKCDIDVKYVNREEAQAIHDGKPLIPPDKMDQVLNELKPSVTRNSYPSDSDIQIMC